MLKCVVNVQPGSIACLLSCILSSSCSAVKLVNAIFRQDKLKLPSIFLLQSIVRDKYLLSLPTHLLNLWATPYFQKSQWTSAIAFSGTQNSPTCLEVLIFYRQYISPEIKQTADVKYYSFRHIVPTSVNLHYCKNTLQKELPR